MPLNEPSCPVNHRSGLSDSTQNVETHTATHTLIVLDIF